MARSLRANSAFHVNGVRNAADILKNGDLVTVDGHLGIVTVGAAEFDLELGVSGEL